MPSQKPKPKSAQRRSATATKAKAPARKPAVQRAKKVAKPSKPAKRPRIEGLVRARPETLRLRSIAASFTVSDIDRALVFYSKGLGFFVHEKWMNEGQLEAVTLRAGFCEINLTQDDWKKGRERVRGDAARLWLETVQDLDAIAERAESFGAVITEWPADREWGVRSLSLDDPDGFHLSFFRRL